MSGSIPKIGGNRTTGGLLSAGLVGGLLGSQADQAEAAQNLARSLNQPTPAERVMPTIDAEAVKKAKKNSLLALQQRSGRASTLLTNQSPQNNTFG